MDGAGDRYGKMRFAYKILIGKSEGKKLRRRPRNRWNNNITMDTGETGLGWINLPPNRGQWRTLVYMVRNGRLP
jgi:hypothetical protein